MVLREVFKSRLVLALLLFVMLVGCARFPGDAAIEEDFRQHDAEFKELVVLIESAYRGVGSLYSFDGYGDYLRAQPRYTELTAAVGASRTPVMGDFYYSREAERRLREPRPAAIYFVLDTLRFPNSAGIFGEEKGVVHFPSSPTFDNTCILVPDTARAEVTDTDSLTFCRRIEGDWYVYRNIED